MSAIKELPFKKPLCVCCRYRQENAGNSPTVYRGTKIQPGETFCDCGKRPKAFRGKCGIYPPKWCPLLEQPAIVRVFRLKDERCEFFHWLHPERPESIHYAEVCRTTTDHSAKGIYDAVAAGEKICDVLDLAVENCDVIEINNGLQVYCLYVFYGKLYNIFFLPKEQEAESV